MAPNAERLVRHIQSAGLDGVVAATKENLVYTLGIESVPLEMFPHAAQSFAVLSKEAATRPAFVSSRCEIDQFVDADTPLAATVAYGTFYREVAQTSGVLTPAEEALNTANGDGELPDEPGAALVEALRVLGLDDKVVGIDDEGVTQVVLERVRRDLPSARLVGVSELLRDVRSVKTEGEVGRLRAAALAAEAAICVAVADARPGATERDLVRALETELARGGARARFSLIKFGARGVFGQSKPTIDPLLPGETIWFDVGCVLDGYWADIARTYAVGPPQSRTAGIYAALRAGIQAAFLRAVPGMTGAELYELTLAEVRGSGLPGYRRGHLGHGIGVEVYEPPLIRPGETRPIEVGTVVNIEAPYYEFRLGAVHVEDAFVVREGGNAWLTQSPMTIPEIHG